ncbi:MAG: hypothetical protein AAGC77_04665 [Pseudomonadota bacterium]
MALTWIQKLKFVFSGGIVIAVVASTSAALAARYEANEITFKDVTATIEIISMASAEDINVSITQGKTYRAIETAIVDGVLVLEGEPWRADEAHDCCDRLISRDVNLRADRQTQTAPAQDIAFFEDYPVIRVTTPLSTDVNFEDVRMQLDMDRIDGALNLDGCYVYGEASDVAEASIGILSGSRLIIGNVGAGLEVDISGDADFMAGQAASVDIDIAGPGDVILGVIDGMLDVSIAGSGSVRATGLDGPMTARIAGSGLAAVRSGRADRLRATMDGSGLVYFGGETRQPELRLSGSSEVRLQSVSGRIDHKGGGAVFVDGARIELD